MLQIKESLNIKSQSNICRDSGIPKPCCFFIRSFTFHFFRSIRKIFRNNIIFEKDAIKPYCNNVNNNQDWNQYSPLVWKFIGNLLNTKNRQIASD